MKYKKDAFTKAHRDAQHKTDLTLITFVSLPDLLGGESIVFECIEGTENYEVPVIVPNLKAGDGLLYTSKVKHAVGKVHSGARIVHVCWFRK